MTLPSPDRILFPWEAEMSDIEWAVANVLRKKHPDIYRELLDDARKRMQDRFDDERDRPK